MKRIVLIISIISIFIISCILLFVSFNEDNYLLKITDVSCSCPSNSLYVYKDKSYVLIGIDGEVLDEGKIDYKDSMDTLICDIKNSDKNDMGLNYQVEFINYDYYVVDKYSDNKLNEFLSLIDYDNLFFSWKDK